MFKPKWCHQCFIMRDPKTAHCYTCGCCIRGMDHHNFVLDVCIGARNFKYFNIACIGCFLFNLVFPYLCYFFFQY